MCRPCTRNARFQVQGCCASSLDARRRTSPRSALGPSPLAIPQPRFGSLGAAAAAAPQDPIVPRRRGQKASPTTRRVAILTLPACPSGLMKLLKARQNMLCTGRSTALAAIVDPGVGARQFRARVQHALPPPVRADIPGGAPHSAAQCLRMFSSSRCVGSLSKSWRRLRLSHSCGALQAVDGRLAV